MYWFYNYARFDRFNLIIFFPHLKSYIRKLDKKLWQSGTIYGTTIFSKIDLILFCNSKKNIHRDMKFLLNTKSDNY